MFRLHEELDNFHQDVVANLQAAATNPMRTMDALRAITLDALLLEQRIRNEEPNNSQICQKSE